MVKFDGLGKLMKENITQIFTQLASQIAGIAHIKSELPC